MEFNQAQSGLEQARSTTNASRDEVYRLRHKLDAVERAIKLASRSFNAEGNGQTQNMSALLEQQSSLQGKIKEENVKLQSKLQSESLRLKDFSQFTDPRQNLPKLNDLTPILMMPLRLETRFKQVNSPDNGKPIPQLWVRVFPDDIAVDTFEPILSDTELRNAQSYWVARWAAADSETEQRGAWRNLVAAHSSGRAWWIIQNYLPDNAGQIPQTKTATELILAIGCEYPLDAVKKTTVAEYWEAVWRAAGDVSVVEDLTANLIDAVGEEFAQEIITHHVPYNISAAVPGESDYVSAQVTVVFVEFPDPEALAIKQQSWSVPPKVNVMPERLLVLGYYNNELELQTIGEPIASPLIVGPDPASTTGPDINFDGDDLVVSDDMRWMIDFEEAVTKGMGFKIDLNPEQARRGFDRLLVVGVRLSADRDKGQSLLEELLQHHHSSRKGLSILRQGTPTNNTDKADAGYNWHEDSDVSFDHYFPGNETVTEEAKPDWSYKTDSEWLSELLGINYSIVENIENASATEYADARAMNLALWPATLGYFMESMMDPVFSDRNIVDTRRFFIENISARGILPALRVGNQPYGILPATVYSRMSWLEPVDINLTHDVASFGSGSYLSGLYSVLQEIDKTWAALKNDVSRVGKSGDAHQILLDIVGLHPTSAEVHARYAQSLEHLYNYYNLIGHSLARSRKFNPEKYTQGGLDLLKKFGFNGNAKTGIPDILSKFFFGLAERLTGKLIDDQPLSETASLRAQAGDRNYIEWLIDAARSSHDVLRRQAEFDDGLPPTALLYLMLQHALDLSYIEGSLRLHQQHELMSRDAVRAAKIEPRFIHIEQEADKGSRWQYLYKKEPIITNSNTLPIYEFIPTQLGSGAFATQQLDEMLGALAHLKSLPTAKLERAFVEHLDLCAYRYDAWMQGLVNHHLQIMRNIPDDGESSTRQGIYLGAYGWLEEVKPKRKTLTPVLLEGELKKKFLRPQDAPLVSDSSNGGFILTPSLNHAVTAAVLRNGYISNRRTPASKPFAINLSSERVRMALNIIEGMREGQSIGALLGYQLERGLHDRHDVEVDEIIYDLRMAFPLVANQMQSTKTDEAESIEQLEARNVVDGLAMIEHIEKTGATTYPYGKDLPGDIEEDQRDAIDAEVQRIIELNDAVADLALAEGVHQVVQGNYDRGAAVLDSYSKGHLPPTPDVVQTPRNGITITQRAGLQFTPGIAPADPRNTTPRSKAEPAMNDWLASVLPAMTDIVCAAEYYDHATATKVPTQISMDELGLLPIDLLYLVNTSNEQAMSALDDMIYLAIIAKHSPRPDAEIKLLYTTSVSGKITVFEIASLLGSLRPMLLQSRPLTSGDVKPANEASKSEEDAVSLDRARVDLLVSELDIIARTDDPAASPLQQIIDALTVKIDAKDIDGLIDDLDTTMGEFVVRFSTVGRFGLQQTGTGFLFDWRRRTFTQLMDKVQAVVTRLQQHATDYEGYIALYDPAASDENNYDILKKAERSISTALTLPLPAPAEYFNNLQTIKKPDFDAQQNRIADLLTTAALPDLFDDIATEQVTLANFDLIGIDITAERDQVLVFADDLRIGAENLLKDLTERLAAVEDLMSEIDTVTGKQQVKQITAAVKKLLHDDFRMVPEFTLAQEQVDEWQNSLNNTSQLLRYLTNEKAIDFPVDDWLYGMARVREKMHHVENALMLTEALTGTTLQLTPAQLPYRATDYWLAMPYPDTIDATTEAFVIDEDKILYTAIYSQTPLAGTQQCGVLLDEWTEIIPVPEATVGLTFHFDQPNSEPPQTLLLLTPTQHGIGWQWQDVVDSLHETLDMAKKRAVEPDQIDKTEYSRFLPALVSAVTAYPITASLKLANNNKYYAQVNLHD